MVCMKHHETMQFRVYGFDHLRPIAIRRKVRNCGFHAVLWRCPDVFQGPLIFWEPQSRSVSDAPWSGVGIGSPQLSKIECQKSQVMQNTFSRLFGKQMVVERSKNGISLLVSICRLVSCWICQLVRKTPSQPALCFMIPACDMWVFTCFYYIMLYIMGAVKDGVIPMKLVTEWENVWTCLLTSGFRSTWPCFQTKLYVHMCSMLWDNHNWLTRASICSRKSHIHKVLPQCEPTMNMFSLVIAIHNHYDSSMICGLYDSHA